VRIGARSEEKKNEGSREVLSYCFRRKDGCLGQEAGLNRSRQRAPPWLLPVTTGA